MGTKLVLCPKDITTGAMRAGGAITLLPGKIDYDKANLLGRWISNQMMTYLHTPKSLILQKFPSVMVDHWDYSQVHPP